MKTEDIKRLDFTPTDLPGRQDSSGTKDFDPQLASEVRELITSLRQRLAMDVAFVSRIAEGHRTFMVVDQQGSEYDLREGSANRTEESWCGLVVSGRAPEVIRDARALVGSGELPNPGILIGTHLSTPILAHDGSVYGTLCTFSKEIKGPEVDHHATILRKIAQLVGERLAKARLGGLH